MNYWAAAQRRLVDLVDQLNVAAELKLVTILNLDHEASNAFYDPIYQFRVYNLSTYQGWPSDMAQLAINDLGRHPGGHNRIFYLPCYCSMPVNPPAKMFVTTFGFNQATRFWFENKTDAMLFKLQFG